MGHRRSLLEKDLLYLFSEDGNLEGGREDIGFAPGGVRVNVFSSPDESRCYNVSGETRVLGERVFAGTIAWGGDFAFASRNDVEVLDVRIVIRTDDGALIEGAYGGVLPGGPRSFRQVVTEKPKVGSEQHPVEAPFYVAPRFRTADRRYRWLSGRQCLAFGRIKFIESIPRQATMDVWMMD